MNDLPIISGIRDAQGLPAAGIAAAVNAKLRSCSALVVTAPPGAGKSTLLPLTILKGLTEQGSRQKILMLEPRRLAARQIATRMAAMLDEPVGKTVGYRVRMESRISADTRIEVLTEGILTRMLIDDPTLDGVGMVIFDEFHERSLTSDLSLALTREAQQVIRPDLRIVIMSATIDTTSICTALKAEKVSCEGRMFPVEIFRSDASESQLTPQSRMAEIAAAVAHRIREAHARHEGDILAFLPGEAEIRCCAELLDGALGQTHICPLYGMLPPMEQQMAIAPSQPGERKVVLATPIAETSLTIEGVRVVIDSGLCRRMVFDQQTGLSHLRTVQVSLDMATQRSGRAGRMAPGVCYRLWSLATEHRMAECRVPEVLDADLSPALLDIAAWGESDAMRLPWLTPPPAAHVSQASRLLQLLHAVDPQGHITSHGRSLAQLPCHPRIAQMLTFASDDSSRALAADLAAMLEEKSPSARRIVSEQYCRLMHVPQHTRRSDNPGPLIATAFPERIAQAIPEGCGRFRLASGDIVRVDEADSLSAHQWLAVASAHTQNGGVGRMFLAAPIEAGELEPYIWQKDRVVWDGKRGCLVAQCERRVGCLLVDSKPLDTSNPALHAELLRTICEAAPKDGTSMFDFNDEVGNLQRRVAVIAGWHPELELPDLSTEAVLARTDEWLPMLVGASRGFKSLQNVTAADLRKLNLTSALWSLLSYGQQQSIEQLAPTHITVPTGSRIRVEYRQGAESPVLRVRLQECFGLTDTPRVDNGRRPVLMELLSPGFKPVQLTQDLRSFWQNTYFEVRKELKRRYPKHFWPDNPLEAEAVHGVKRKR